MGSHGFLTFFKFWLANQQGKQLIESYRYVWVNLCFWFATWDQTNRTCQVLPALSPQHSFGPSLREVAACAKRMASDSLWVEAISDLIPCCGCGSLCVHDGELCKEKPILECKHGFSTRNWTSRGKSLNDGELGHFYVFLQIVRCDMPRDRGVGVRTQIWQEAAVKDWALPAAGLHFLWKTAWSIQFVCIHIYVYILYRHINISCNM